MLHGLLSECQNINRLCFGRLQVYVCYPIPRYFLVCLASWTNLDTSYITYSRSKRCSRQVTDSIGSLSEACVAPCLTTAPHGRGPAGILQSRERRLPRSWAKRRVSGRPSLPPREEQGTYLALRQPSQRLFFMRMGKDATEVGL